MKFKKVISVLLALSMGVFAFGEDIVSKNAQTNKNRGNGYYGFALKLADTSIVTTTPVSAFADLDSVFLKSLDLYSRSTNGGSSVEFKVAVYTYTSDGNVGKFLGLSNESQTSSWGHNKLSFTFDSLSLSLPSTSTYQFLFVNSSTTAETLKDSGLEGFKSAATGVSLELINGAALPQGSGTYKNNTLNSWESNYLPEFEIRTAAIPEPSMFGVLAGMGVLALVSSRRRRK